MFNITENAINDVFKRWKTLASLSALALMICDWPTHCAVPIMPNINFYHGGQSIPWVIAPTIYRTDNRELYPPANHFKPTNEIRKDFLNASWCKY